MKNLIYYTELTLIITLLGSCANVNSTIDYESVRARKNTIKSTILATGIIKPKIGAEVRVGSRVSGVVKRLYVKNGDTVRKGELLAQLDDSELSATYRLQMANLNNAETVLKYARIEMDRVKPLVEKDLASQQSYDNAVKNYDMAIASVASAKASVDYAATELSYARITAPIAGVIGSVTTQEGETVAATFAAPTFVTIIDLSRIEVWAYVDETDIGRVKTGQKVSFTVDTYTGCTFEGVVSAIYPEAVIRENVVNYVVVVEIADKQNRILRPEMTTSVTIQTSDSVKVLSVPNNAIRWDEGESVVYLLKDGKPVKQKIKTGIKGNELTEVTDGLKENDKVITNMDEISFKQ